MQPKRPRGRPPASGKAMTQIAIRLPDAMLDKIDELAQQRLDAPDRSDVIRQLLAEAITAREKARR